MTFDALFHFDEQNTQHLLVHYLRAAHGLAILVGAALSAAGVIMQAMTRNPLAAPGILGVNAGAILMVVIGIAGFWLTDMLHNLWFDYLARQQPVWAFICWQVSINPQTRASGAGWCGDDGGALVHDGFDYAQ